MLIISNNLIGKTPIPKRAIIRVNLAWLKSIDEARCIIRNSRHDIYLDYPQGRTKPPKPIIKFDDAIRLTNYSQVKYFAVSNIEQAEDVRHIMDSLRDVEFIPKIETKTGVKNLKAILAEGIKTIMLDKEDIYTDVGCNSTTYNQLVTEARNANCKVLELKGVVFK